MLHLEPLLSYSNGRAVPMDLQSHLVQPPGPKWFHMSRMALPSLLLSNERPRPLEPPRDTLAPSYLLHHWNADRMAALPQWTAETTL